MTGFSYIVGDVFEADLPARGFALVYGDPPYANCRFKYARQNSSRQWGKNARADFTRELVAVMDRLRAPGGVCALSMTSNEALRLGPLFPSTARMAAWTKPFAPHRPHVWPTYAWEPVVIWGKLPGREEQLASKTPHDWFNLSPKVPRGTGHETPKPDAFAAHILNLTLGPRRGPVCELFAGTAPVARLAADLGMEAVAVDLVRPETVMPRLDEVRAAE